VEQQGAADGSSATALRAERPDAARSQSAVSLVLAPGAEQIVYVFCEFESVPAEGVCGAAGWKDGQTNSVGIQPLTRCNGGLGIACAHMAMPALILFPLTTFYA
jgi:hypothetical protein